MCVVNYSTCTCLRPSFMIGCAQTMNIHDCSFQPMKLMSTLLYVVHLHTCMFLSLTTSQPDYLHNLISVQSSGRTRSSSLVTLARPSVSSSLQTTNRSFTYASPYLWNQFPSSFRQPHSVHCPPGSPHPAHITRSHHLSLNLSLQT